MKKFLSLILLSSLVIVGCASHEDSSPTIEQKTQAACARFVKDWNELDEQYLNHVPGRSVDEAYFGIEAYRLKLSSELNVDASSDIKDAWADTLQWLDVSVSMENTNPDLQLSSIKQFIKSGSDSKSRCE